MKRRYVIFSSLLFLAIFGIGTIVFIMLMQSIARENVTTELMWSVERERLKLEAGLHSEITLVKKMADSPLIRQHLQDPADNRLRPMALEALASYSKAFASSDVFWISDRDKKYHFKDKYLYTLNPAEKGSEWYDLALKMTDSFQLKVYFDVGLKKTMLWVDAPVFNDRRIPVGIVGIGLHLDDFVKMTYQSYQGTDELYFLNSDGEITGARDIGLIENKTNIADYLGQTGAEILAATKELSGTSGVQCFETGKKLAIAIDPIPMMGWYVVAVHHFVLSESLPIGMTMLFVVAMAIIFICFAILNLFVIKMLNPLNSLIKDVNKTLLDWELKQNKEDSGEVGTLGEFIKMAIIDPLTTVYNRRYFDGQLKQLLKSLSRSGSELSLLMIDIDYFKKYNDSYGHSAGDACLKKVAAALVQCQNRSEDFVARYGGDEFIVVLPHTDQDGARMMAERLLETVRERNIPHGVSDIADYVTISIGGATGMVNHLQRTPYIKLADDALYESKKCGRNRYTLKTFE